MLPLAEGTDGAVLEHALGEVLGKDDGYVEGANDGEAVGRVGCIDGACTVFACRSLVTVPPPSSQLPCSLTSLSFFQ